MFKIFEKQDTMSIGYFYITKQPYLMFFNQCNLYVLY